MYYILRFQMAPEKILALAVYVYGDEYSKEELTESLKKILSPVFRYAV